MNLEQLDKLMHVILDVLPPGVELSTRQLLDEISKRSDVEPRDRSIYDMIDKLAPKFQNHWKNGQPFQKYGRTMTPKIWHRPTPTKALIVRCPHCGTDFTP